MKKRCTLCKVEKPIEDFPGQRSQPDGHSCWCKPCHCAKSKAWREKNPEKAKATRKAYHERNPRTHRQATLRKQYGMELEDYDRLLEAQDGVCAICGRSEADSKKGYLCVDHIEGTLLVRGLLCSFCNCAIGLLGHDADRLRVAIGYLSASPVFEGTKVPQGIHRSRLPLAELPSPAAEWISASAAAIRFGIPRPTLSLWGRQGLLGDVMRHGRSNCYRIEVLEKILVDGKRPKAA